MKFSEFSLKLEKDGIEYLKTVANKYVSLREKHGMVHICIEQYKNLIKKVDGFAILDRLQYELILYSSLLWLYIPDMEIDEDVTDVEYDVLARNKFVKLLGVVTDKDSFNYEQTFKNIILDKIRKENSNPNPDIEAIKALFTQFGDMMQNNPDIIKIVDFDGATTKKAIRETVKSERSKNK